jgi:hypothetical protein
MTRIFIQLFENTPGISEPEPYGVRSVSVNTQSQFIRGGRQIFQLRRIPRFEAMYNHLLAPALNDQCSDRTRLMPNGSKVI